MRRPRAGRGPGACLRRASALPLALVCALLLVPACDDSFAPILPAEQRLSVWGYLDATADTQWIRVGLMRPVVQTSPDSLPVRVTLENLSAGGVIELRQVIQRFGSLAGDDAAVLYAHNFWTTERIEPGGSYRFRAEPSTGQAAEALVQVPPEFDVEVLLAQRWVSRPDSVRLVGLRHVAFVAATSYYADSCGSDVERKSFSASPADTFGTIRSVAVSRTILARAPACGRPTVSRRVLWLAGSAAPWPADQAYAPRLGPAAPSNITNGVGFLGGILTRTVPYENCDYVAHVGMNNFCRLHYDSTSASLSGRVWDAQCNFAVPRATVRLQELDPAPPEVARIRWALTDTAGGYWIGGLVPGTHYALSIARNESPDPLTAEYAEHTATLQLTPGEQATHDATLLRQYFPCPSQP